MLIAHLSDLHIIAQPDAPGLVRPDATERARALLADVTEIWPRPDLVVLSGDNANDGRPEEYAILANMLATFDIPLLMVPGNHDMRAPMRTAFPALRWEDGTFLQCEWRSGDLRVIGLDTLSDGETGGRLCAVRLDWLRARLSIPFGGQTLIVMHHPPCASRMGVLDQAGLLEGAAALHAMLTALPGQVSVLCGHIHRPFTANWGGVPVFAATSTAFEFGLSIDDPQEPGLSAEPYHYALHLFDDAGGHVIHRRLPPL